MALVNRFARKWDEWDASIQGGGDASVMDLLRSTKDEVLIELLAGDSIQDRRYERDIIVTEIQNRLSQRNKDLPEGAEEVLRSAYRTYDAAITAQGAMHAAEHILTASGEADTAISVSASAIATLSSAKVALELAQEHATKVRAIMAQSRVADTLLQEAVENAADTARRAAEAAVRLAQLGHEAEAQAALRAAEKIRDAVAQSARKLREKRDA